MVHKTSTQVSLGIFGSQQKTNHPKLHAIDIKPKLVDLGGDGDCGFLSAAGAMINNIVLIPSRANKNLAKKLLTFHETYFDQKEISKRLMEPDERLKELLKGLTLPERAKFLAELAYALRQETVNFITSPQNRVRYRGCYVKNNEGTSPQQMRLQSTWIDESAIDALSKVVQVPIMIREVEPNKEGHSRTPYSYFEGIAEPASPITMQLQGYHYIPELSTNSEYFESISRLKIEAVKPKASAPVPEDPDLEVVRAEIAANDQLLLEEFESTVIRLTTNVEEFSKEKLLDIYIKGMQKSDYLQGRIKYVGIEHGNQVFFEEIAAARKGDKPISFPKASHDDLVRAELVHAIARALSIGQIDSTLVYGEEALSQAQGAAPPPPFETDEESTPRPS
ncbi:MAG: hypothetical protein H0U73_03635 [Tatlockia sp.]|nr:hypothetical protein [Tatlockia sp.]